MKTTTLKAKAMSILLAIVMLLGMLPMSVFAADNSTALTITGGTDYTYENGVLDITAAGTYEIKNADPLAATDDTIRVSAASGKVIVKLGGVNINPTDKSAFEITGDCETTVILKDGTENTLDNTTANSLAGLQNGEKVLTVTCESSGNTAHECTTDCGKLTAMSFWGAGIGGGNGGNGSNITVSGGNVTATSGQWGAGIGGGYTGSGSNITVSGGTVTATSGQWGAGIGGGYNGSAGNIKITPSANTEILVNTGANASEAEELTYAFAEEMDITALVSQNAYFYSEAYCIHADADKDHECDFGCGETMGIHDDTTLDHACDYGCSVTIGTCEDTDKDHDCDYGCNKTFGTHVAASGKHTCDYCGNAVTTCTDFAEAVKQEALKSAADCTNPAVYFKSCTVCGANGTETFISGEALGHTYENGKCTDCGYVDPASVEAIGFELEKFDEDRVTIFQEDDIEALIAKIDALLAEENIGEAELVKLLAHKEQAEKLIGIINTPKEYISPRFFYLILDCLIWKCNGILCLFSKIFVC